MRAIKFRAWRKNSLAEYMDYEPTLDSGIATSVYINDLIKENDAVLMQFTGLHDKNGTEIYEEDIVLYKHYYAIKNWWRNTEEIPEIEKSVQKQRDDFGVCKDVIRFKKGGFRLNYGITGNEISIGYRFEKGSSHTHDFEEKDWDFEVIGNIYENPELLEREQIE